MLPPNKSHWFTAVDSDSDMIMIYDAECDFICIFPHGLWLSRNGPGMLMGHQYSLISPETIFKILFPNGVPEDVRALWKTDK